mgnify:CR=1 FL=1
MLEHGIEVPQEWIISDRDMECGVVEVDIHPDQMKDMPTICMLLHFLNNLIVCDILCQ